MISIPHFIVLLSLAIMTFQDFRFRSISVWLPILLLTGLILSTESEFRSLGESATVNTSILLLLLAFTLSLMLLFKGKSTPVTAMLGLGDIVVLLVFTPFMESSEYLLFILCSCIVALLADPLIKLIWGGQHTTVPFVGYISLAYLLLEYSDIQTKLYGHIV